MLIQTLQNNPQLYVVMVMSVMVSIVLHELAHGWAAMALGDDTPIETGRMTGNPLVHMGLFSIVVLLVAGIAWGQMPINPSRLRGKRGEAIVAVAGPLANVILGLVALTAFALWMRFGDAGGDGFVQVLRRALFTMGYLNFALAMFNLIPLPPLDGSHILANFHRGYAQLLNDPRHQPAFFFAFIIVFVIAPKLFDWALAIALAYIEVIT